MPAVVRATIALIAATALLGAARADASPGVAGPGQRAFVLGAGNTLRTVDVATPSDLSAPLAVQGVDPGETLVGIDVRPVNGMLYALGVNATANTATLYVVSPQTGIAGVVGGTASQIAFVDAGANTIDLPASGYGFDVNPLADRVRVTAGSLSFRVNPNTGAPVDGDLVAAGTNPDGAINGASSAVSEVAYTNSDPVATATTLYTLDAATDELAIQNPPNAGTQTSAIALKLAGAPVDLTSISGFDLDQYASASVSNGPAPSNAIGYVTATRGGATRLFTVNLTDGTLTDLGTIGDGTVAVSGFALQRDADDGFPIVALNGSGTRVGRLTTAAPGGLASSVAVPLPVGSIAAAIAWRPLTGQLLLLAVDPVAELARLGTLDPVSGVFTQIGAGGSWVTSTDQSLVDLPVPGVARYGMDVNPAADRVRITTDTGLNLRMNPITGTAIDGNQTATGTNPDGGGPALGAVAYTNGFGQASGAGITSLYGIDAGADRLLRSSDPNAGTYPDALPITVDGAPLSFGPDALLDLPSSVSTTASNAAGRGRGFLITTPSGSVDAHLYELRVQTGAAVDLGVSVAFRGMAVGNALRDITAPTLSLPYGDGVINTNPRITFSGTGQDGAVVTVAENGTTLCTTTAKVLVGWSCDSTIALPDGLHTVSVTQTDLEGNVSPAVQRTFLVRGPSTAPPATTPPATTPPPTNLPAPGGSCAPRRVVTLRFAKGARRATATVAGKRVTVKRVKGRLTIRVDLRKRAAGTVVVRLTSKTKRGRTVKVVKRYRLCPR